MSDPKSNAAEPDIKTRIIHAGAEHGKRHSIVNTPVYHASTCLFDSFAAFREAVSNPDHGLFYGRRGTPTQWALEDALKDLEAGSGGVCLYPSGMSAISTALMAYLEPGDQLLMVDTVYEPVRSFCDKVLARNNIETKYYPPSVGEGISDYVSTNTKAVFLESPGSLTFEVQDIPAISKVAHDADAMTFADSTWGTPLSLPAHDLGIDINLHALTKYEVGHSDVMMGAASATPKYFNRLQSFTRTVGICVSPDDAYLCLRGLKTMAMRLETQFENGLQVANWLKAHPMVAHVYHPALPDDPGYALWQRDFTGGCGLFGFRLKHGSWQDLPHLVDDLRYFGMGFSWGGYESLILPVMPETCRSATRWPKGAPVLRLHIGLESPSDLIDDLEGGLSRYDAALKTSPD
ncbi:MAG: cystathionine beta-lyase [Pseudomonadota bacterium]